MIQFVLRMVKLIVMLTVLLLHYVGFSQYTIPEVPKFQTSVYDYANLLQENEKQQLESKLVRYSDSTTTQIVAITIDDLKGEDISQLATKWAHTWGIGQAKEDNGILILLSKNERKIHIVNGYGIEDRMTAGITGEIIRNVIVPEFKAGSYYNGLDKGADAIFDVLKGKYKGERKGDKDDGSGGIFIIILVFVVIIIILSSRNRRGGGGSGGRFSGSDLADIIILSSLGRSSSGGGWSSGGGFGGGGSGGFGGGGFSGGGAGGSW